MFSVQSHCLSLYTCKSFPTNVTAYLWILSSSLWMDRDPQPAGRAVQMPGATVRVPDPAAAGPAGVLPPQSRDPTGVLPQLREADREVLLQDPQLQGTPAVQVSLMWSGIIVVMCLHLQSSTSTVRCFLSCCWLPVNFLSTLHCTCWASGTYSWWLSSKWPWSEVTATESQPDRVPAEASPGRSISELNATEIYRHCSCRPGPFCSFTLPQQWALRGYADILHVPARALMTLAKLIYWLNHISL